MNHLSHKTEGVNRTKTMRFYPFVFTSTDEGGIAAYYNYSADGERNIKFTSPRLNIQQNASLFNNPPLVYPTLYASSLITLTPKGYTNVTEVESRASSLALPRCSNVTERTHYFEEGRRICSKIGGGMRGNVTVEEIDSRVGEMASSYEKQYHTQNDGIRQTFHDCIGADPQIIDGVNLHQMLVEREVRRDEEEPAFFYHSDHLGSAAYLTHRGGVIQTLNYLPYGEDWIELNFAPHDTNRLGIYRFNGKEKDYESSFHYYGARYYWSEVLTSWLSVDPLTDKFPSVSGYSYCINNPVILIDPDGNSPIKGITSAIKIAKKAYNIYKKTGKLTPKALKKAGLEDLVDVAGDLYTIFGSGASLVDRLAAGVDLVIGIDLNKKGKQKVVEALGSILQKGPPANRGIAKPHGGKKHNKAIDDYIENLPEGADNVRKNQVQVDINGNRVGNNRPDVQYDYNGQHYNVVFDNNSSNSVKHERTIRENDPNSQIETYQL